MAKRIDAERQAELEPQRIQTAKDEITALGYDITFESATEIRFVFMGKTVNYFPYSGWHSGATIKDGRGLHNLLRQIKI